MNSKFRLLRTGFGKTSAQLHLCTRIERRAMVFAVFMNHRSFSMKGPATRRRRFLISSALYEKNLEIFSVAIPEPWNLPECSTIDYSNVLVLRNLSREKTLKFRDNFNSCYQWLNDLNNTFCVSSNLFLGTSFWEAWAFPDREVSKKKD